jgi:hypothetical protein
MNTTNELALIVVINEDIKRVVKLARRINILALNAILLSRRAGSVALGFGVIADELRSFSKDLTLSMQGLMQVSYGCVQTVSLCRRHRRMNNLMAQAQQQSAEYASAMGAHGRAQRLASLQGQLLQTYEQLQRLLVDAQAASRFGSVIARSLKIEATYGNNFSGLLAQIAQEFAHDIEAIPDLLQRLQHTLPRNL